MSEDNFFKEWMTAPRWKLWLAKMFGTRHQNTDGGVTVVCYDWRGITYITDIIEPDA